MYSGPTFKRVPIQGAPTSRVREPQASGRMVVALERQVVSDAAVHVCGRELLADEQDFLADLGTLGGNAICRAGYRKRARHGG